MRTSDIDAPDPSLSTCQVEVANLALSRKPAGNRFFSNISDGDIQLSSVSDDPTMLPCLKGIETSTHGQVHHQLMPSELEFRCLKLAKQLGGFLFHANPCLELGINTDLMKTLYEWRVLHHHSRADPVLQY